MKKYLVVGVREGKIVRFRREGEELAMAAAAKLLGMGWSISVFGV